MVAADQLRQLAFDRYLWIRARWRRLHGNRRDQIAQGALRFCAEGFTGLDRPVERLDRRQIRSTRLTFTAQPAVSSMAAIRR
ncbi:hypothetical protein ASE66_13885 [Bosea sp. Root483D1]|nr:hypothetical protein ASE66_13885 [Bosea sp. Root483D1]